MRVAGNLYTSVDEAKKAKSEQVKGYHEKDPEKYREYQKQYRGQRKLEKEQLVCLQLENQKLISENNLLKSFVGKSEQERIDLKKQWDELEQKQRTDIETDLHMIHIAVSYTKFVLWLQKVAPEKKKEFDDLFNRFAAFSGISNC